MQFRDDTITQQHNSWTGHKSQTRGHHSAGSCDRLNKIGHAMTQDFIIAPFAPTNRSRAYLTRNGQNTSSQQKRKPTARDAAKLARQKILATSASSRINIGRVGKAKIKAKRAKARKPMRKAGPGEDEEQDSSEDATMNDDGAHEKSAEPAANSTYRAERELSAPEKVFGIFELCEIIVSNLPTHDLFRTRGVNQTVKAAINDSKVCKEKLFLTPTSAPPVTWLWTVGEDVYHSVPYAPSSAFPGDWIGDSDQASPYDVQQPRHLNSMVLRRGQVEPVRHPFQHWPRKLLNCSACTYAAEEESG